LQPPYQETYLKIDEWKSRTVVGL
jgi:hypothetical protein